MFSTLQYCIIIAGAVLVLCTILGKVQDFIPLIIILALLFFVLGTSWIGKHKDSKHSDIWKEVTSHGDTSR